MLECWVFLTWDLLRNCGCLLWPLTSVITWLGCLGILFHSSTDILLLYCCSEYSFQLMGCMVLWRLIIHPLYLANWSRLSLFPWTLPHVLGLYLIETYSGTMDIPASSAMHVIPRIWWQLTCRYFEELWMFKALTKVCGGSVPTSTDYQIDCLRLLVSTAYLYHHFFVQYLVLCLASYSAQMRNWRLVLHAAFTICD